MLNGIVNTPSLTRPERPTTLVTISHPKGYPRVRTRGVARSGQDQDGGMLHPGPWPLAPGPWFSCSEGLGTYAFPALFSGFPGMHVGSEA